MDEWTDDLTFVPRFHCFEPQADGSMAWTATNPLEGQRHQTEEAGRLRVRRALYEWEIANEAHALAAAGEQVATRGRGC